MFCQFLNMFCISRTLCIIATDQYLNIYFKSTQIIELQKLNERKKSLSLHSAVFPLKKRGISTFVLSCKIEIY